MQFGEAMNFCGCANGLSQLQGGQFLNDKIPKNQRDQESRHRRGNGAERDIKEDVEANELIAQAMEVVHHGEVSTEK